jgi:hypothetical protein
MGPVRVVAHEMFIGSAASEATGQSKRNPNKTAAAIILPFLAIMLLLSLHWVCNWFSAMLKIVNKKVRR